MSKVQDVESGSNTSARSMCTRSWDVLLCCCRVVAEKTWRFSVTDDGHLMCVTTWVNTEYHKYQVERCSIWNECFERVSQRPLIPRFCTVFVIGVGQHISCEGPTAICLVSSHVWYLFVKCEAIELWNFKIICVFGLGESFQIFAHLLAYFLV